MHARRSVRGAPITPAPRMRADIGLGWAQRCWALVGYPRRWKGCCSVDAKQEEGRAAAFERPCDGARARGRACRCGGGQRGLVGGATHPSRSALAAESRVAVEGGNAERSRGCLILSGLSFPLDECLTRTGNRVKPNIRSCMFGHEVSQPPRARLCQPSRHNPQQRRGGPPSPSLGTLPGLFARRRRGSGTGRAGLLAGA